MMERYENRVRTIKADRTDPLYSVVGSRMTRLRQDQGLTQWELAQELGVNGATITNYETGRSRIPLAFFVRWCKLLHEDPGYILDQAVREGPVERDSWALLKLGQDTD